MLSQPSAADRFWIRVNKLGPTPTHCPELGPCWIWTGPLEKTGYARFWVERRNQFVHRFSYEVTNGHIGDSKRLVMHKCDNRACANPGHLTLGTHLDNSRDAVTKDRQAYGERTSRSKLTNQQVREIRASVDSGVVLAKRYGVSKTTISCVRLRHGWKHVA
jgi:hypothetical protein